MAAGTAVGISISCTARPLGGPKVELTERAHVLGTFAPRTSWGLVLFGAILTIGGIAGLIAGATYDAELEKTHAHALMFLLIPGLLLVWPNLVPFLKRGKEFRAHPDGSVSVRTGDGDEALLEYRYATVTADGSVIHFEAVPDGPPGLVLPQQRVFARAASGSKACPTASTSPRAADRTRRVHQT